MRSVIKKRKTMKCKMLTLKIERQAHTKAEKIIKIGGKSLQATFSYSRAASGDNTALCRTVGVNSRQILPVETH